METQGRDKTNHNSVQDTTKLNAIQESPLEAVAWPSMVTYEDMYQHTVHRYIQTGF